MVYRLAVTILVSTMRSQYSAAGKALCAGMYPVISSNYLKSIGDERAVHRVYAHKGKELAQVVAEPHQEIHE